MQYLKGKIDENGRYVFVEMSEHYMSYRTLWESILGCRCEAAYRYYTNGRHDLWTIWIRGDDYDVAYDNLQKSIHRSSNVEFFCWDVGMDFGPIPKDVLAWRVSHDDYGHDQITEYWKLYTKVPNSPAGSVNRQGEWVPVDSGSPIWGNIYLDFHIVKQAEWDLVWNSDDAPPHLSDREMDTRLEVYVNGVHVENRYNIWAYTSEDSYVPRAFSEQAPGRARR